MFWVPCLAFWISSFRLRIRALELWEKMEFSVFHTSAELVVVAMKGTIVSETEDMRACLIAWSCRSHFR